MEIILNRTGLPVEFDRATNPRLPKRRRPLGCRLEPTGFATDAEVRRPIKWTFRRSRGRLDGPRLTTEDPLSPESQQFKLIWLREKRNCASIINRLLQSGVTGRCLPSSGPVYRLDRRLAGL
jgi:hypothetical protein